MFLTISSLTLISVPVAWCGELFVKLLGLLITIAILDLGS